MNFQNLGLDFRHQSNNSRYLAARLALLRAGSVAATLEHGFSQARRALCDRAQRPWFGDESARTVCGRRAQYAAATPRVLAISCVQLPDLDRQPGSAHGSGRSVVEKEKTISQGGANCSRCLTSANRAMVWHHREGGGSRNALILEHSGPLG